MGRFSSIAYATRVRSYADFVNTAIAAPEASTLILLIFGFAGLVGMDTWRKRRETKGQA
jgi:hypothetical protein